ncbi:MAG: disulfide bond formation protein DsbB [Saliniramus fredricksonii]|uniref:Disulfide bond formation protein DsbB n=1 Tax=Saliniramus fredricksonii TaxID=1653334 RepID=A0A0P7XPV3_9HYPH|nr:disulfide bond formation protein B [Saliniramus fredricksonii]KPQ09541.1 MAG: disulfide bond formation protein DsbB [Saliniramus fredricksonii]SCC78297.1 Disulfide bond formation protein DsbB [Saliniramus fredricksonii]
MQIIGLLAIHRGIALAIALMGIATIAAALWFEHVVELQPCLLCLYQRWPYYAAIPLALAITLLAREPGPARAGLALIGLIFLAGTGLALYHVGVEMGVFLGPTGCGGEAAARATDMDDFRRQLETVRVIDCSQPAWIFLGISMAGWNAVISFTIALIAFASAATSSGKIALTD